MSGVPALYVSLDAVKRDPALAGGRGARKLLVTSLYRNEQSVSEPIWEPPRGDGPCAVQKMSDTECAVFNHRAEQHRHHHEFATELYMVLEGSMRIEVERREYTLAAGDMIVVNPGSRHEVRPSGTSFLCRVVTVDCGGSADKHLA